MKSHDLACVHNVWHHLRKLMWVYCPRHAGVKGNDRADRLAGKAIITSGLRLGRYEVLRSLRHYLWVQSQKIPHRWPPREERRGKRKPLTTFLEKARQGHRQSHEHWKCLKDNVEETSDRRIRAFPTVSMYSLQQNWTARQKPRIRTVWPSGTFYSEW